MKKRILSLLLVSIMLLTMLPAAALAEASQEAGPQLKMHFVGEDGNGLSSWGGEVYECWEARFYTSDGTTESGTPIQPDSLKLPGFLKLESTDDDGLCC
ncbi:MAG: hypothetical protein SPJ01_04620, partial [Butyricicoccus sp.]|nr:hypothetical protein [Butyricicoccus sp.]